MRKEYVEYKAKMRESRFTEEESRLFWLKEGESDRLSTLYRLATSFMTVNASAISQERQFSELKRRYAELRNRTKIDTLDRDAVVYSWINGTC